MCGIFGFSGFSDRDCCLAWPACLEHRGPDGEGFYEDDPHRFAMGTRRLSIIDLDGETQPIFNEDLAQAVCFNGEIYNYIELHDQLAARGHHSASGDVP